MFTDSTLTDNHILISSPPPPPLRCDLLFRPLHRVSLTLSLNSLIILGQLCPVHASLSVFVEAIGLFWMLSFCIASPWLRLATYHGALDRFPKQSAQKFVFGLASDGVCLSFSKLRFGWLLFCFFVWARQLFTSTCICSAFARFRLSGVVIVMFSLPDRILVCF